MSYSSRVFAFVATVAFTQTVTPAEPVAGFQSDLSLRLGGFAEGRRDLGLGVSDNTSEGYADAQGTFYWNSGRDWSALARVQGFLPSGELVVTDEDQPRQSKSYAALRELWVEYNGLTSYPGEFLRVGRQRLRDPDGLWIDRNIEALRWTFDTTLLQWNIGIAESLFTGRTDDSDPPATLRDRMYFFGGLGRQWTAGHFLGARAMHAFDHANTEQELASGEENPKLSDRRYTWLDLYAHNGYHQASERAGWSYSVDASALVGTREDFRPATLTDAATQTETDVRGWAGDVGLRWRLPITFPLQVGGGYAFGSGSDGGNLEHRYEQTGLHSNRSRFTGTRSQLYRYGEALQPDLTNLHVGTLYVSIPKEHWDASLVYHKFARHRAGDPVVTDGLDVQPVPGRKLLGEGVDVALAYYFSNPIGRGRSTIRATEDDDNLRSNIRLRASGFRPNIAYPKAADDQYRVTLEMTLWF